MHGLLGMHAIRGKHEHGSRAMQMQTLQIQGVIHGISKNQLAVEVSQALLLIFVWKTDWFYQDHAMRKFFQKSYKMGSIFLCFNGKYEEKT